MVVRARVIVVLAVAVYSCGDPGGGPRCAEARDCSDGATCEHGVCVQAPRAEGGVPAPRDLARVDGGPSSDSGDDRPEPPDAPAEEENDVILEAGSLDYASAVVELDVRGEVTVRVEVPDDAHSFVLTVTPPAGNFSIRPLRVSAPSGTIFPASVSRAEERKYVPNDHSSYPGLPYSFMLPNRPELELERGTYTATLEVVPYSPDAVSVDVTWVRGVAPPTGGRIDLLLMVFPDQGLDCLRVSKDPTLGRGTEHANRLFAPAGIEIGDVACVDVGQAGARAARDDEAPFRAVLDEHTGRSPTAMRVALMELGETTGLSFGIPGAPGRAGLLRSSMIAINPSALRWPADLVGRLLAHEIGHHLGLNHVTEEDHVRHDQLQDTPECKLDESDLDEDAGSGTEEACDEARANVMYPAGFSVLPLSDVHFSQDQIWVMRRNPFLALRR
jgi:hypothetical protein